MACVDFTLAALLLCPATTSAQDSAPAAEAPQRADAAARLIPESCFLYLDGSGLAGFAREGLDHPLLRALLESDLARAFTAEQGVAPRELLALAEQMLGRDPFDALETLASGGFALGAELGLGAPHYTFVARSNAPEELEETVRSLLRLWYAQLGTGGEPEPAQEIEGAKVWALYPHVPLGLRAGTLVASTSEARFRESLERLANGGSGLAALPRWRAAHAALAGDELAWSWLDATAARAADNATGDWKEFAAMREQPEVHALLGSAFACAGAAGTFTAALGFGERELRLRMGAQEIDAGPSLALTLAGPGTKARKVLVPASTERELARFSAYRDFAGLYRLRADIFPPNRLPGFSKTSNDLAPILGGLDLGDDLLPGISPWIRGVVREVDFAAGAVPAIPLPALALLFDLEKPDETGPLLTSSFQTAIGVANLQRAQQGQQPMLLELESFAGASISAARFLPPRDDAGVDAIYNLEPACAQVGATFVIGTHRALVKEVVAQLARGEVVEAPADGDWIEVRSAPLARLVRANLEALVTSAVLNEGKTEEKARGELAGLLALIELFDSAELATRQGAADAYSIELALRLASGERAR